MKTKQELTDILDFVAEYASYLLGSGVHTSRVIRNAQRIGTSQGVDIQLSSFQKSIIITVHDERSGEVVTRVVKIPALPISFERNSDLSALSWDAVDEHLSLTDLRDRYGELIAKPRMDPIFVLLTVGLANASFCRLFGGDWTAVGIVFTSTLVGFSTRQWMQAHAVNHFLVFILSAFLASLCAAVVIGFGSLWLGRGIRCPMTVLYIPALLPMVPGIYAYKTVFALIMFLQSLNDPGQGLEYMQQFFLNATVSFSVIILLAAGATLPIFIFNRRAFSLTRRRQNRK